MCVKLKTAAERAESTGTSGKNEGPSLFPITRRIRGFKWKESSQQKKRAMWISDRRCGIETKRCRIPDAGNSQILVGVPTNIQNPFKKREVGRQESECKTQ